MFFIDYFLDEKKHLWDDMGNKTHPKVGCRKAM